MPGSSVAVNESDSGPRSSRTLGGVERALDVLLLFTEPGTASLGVSEIARELELPKAVVHRILTTLCGRRFLELNEATRRYSLGLSWLAMGHAYAQQVDVRDLAREALMRMSRRTNETSTLSIRHGHARIYLDQVTPPREVKMTVQIGAAFPLHAGSSSKAFLAFLDPDEQREYLDTEPLNPLTDHTIVDRSLLVQELETIRNRGYAVSFGERQQGAGAVAAPVLNHESRPAAVVSICGPVHRIQGNVDSMAAILLEESSGLSARLGHS